MVFFGAAAEVVDAGAVGVEGEEFVAEGVELSVGDVELLETPTDTDAGGSLSTVDPDGWQPATASTTTSQSHARDFSISAYLRGLPA